MDNLEQIKQQQQTGVDNLRAYASEQGRSWIPALAKALGITKQTVYYWSNLGVIPLEYVPGIVDYTGGELKASTLRPDVDFDALT